MNEDESSVYRNGGVKEYVAANYVRVLAKLDVLDAKMKTKQRKVKQQRTRRQRFEDEHLRARRDD